MMQLLLVENDFEIVAGLGTALRMEGYSVLAALSGRQGLDLLDRQRIDLVLSELRLPDLSGIDILRHARRKSLTVPVVFVTDLGSTRDIVQAMRLGAQDVLEKPVSAESVLETVQRLLAGSDGDHQEETEWTDPADDNARLDGHAPERIGELEAHAASRWARALMPIIDSPTDPRTIGQWSRLAYVSSGALRNWCRTAGISPRRSLVFARLLRAVYLSAGGRHKLENLLDVVDRRTLAGLLRFAGLTWKAELTRTPDEFLRKQVLVEDPKALEAIRQALAARRARPRSSPATRR
jgi:CheY-like chemotaxis protein